MGCFRLFLSPRVTFCRFWRIFRTVNILLTFGKQYEKRRSSGGGRGRRGLRLKEILTMTYRIECLAWRSLYTPRCLLDEVYVKEFWDIVYPPSCQSTFHHA